MRKIVSLLLLAVLISMLAVPASAGFVQENANQCASVLSITEGTEEIHVPKVYHLQDDKMMEVFNAFREAAAKEPVKEGEEPVIPEDADVHHLTMIRQRDVVSEAEEIELSLRSWGPERYLVVFFCPVDTEDWTVLGCAWGNFIDVVLPGNGQYVLAWAWG